MHHAEQQCAQRRFFNKHLKNHLPFLISTSRLTVLRSNVQTPSYNAKSKRSDWSKTMLSMLFNSFPQSCAGASPKLPIEMPMHQECQPKIEEHQKNRFVHKGLPLGWRPSLLGWRPFLFFDLDLRMTSSHLHAKPACFRAGKLAEPTLNH